MMAIGEPWNEILWAGRGHTFRRREMQDVAIVLEHVDLLNSSYWLQVELLQGSLELLIIGSSGVGRLLDDFPSWCTLSTYTPSSKRER